MFITTLRTLPQTYLHIIAKSHFTTTTKMTSTKSQLLSIYKSAVNSVKPNSLIRNSIRILPTGQLEILEQCNAKVHQVQLANRAVYVFGAGKAVLGMCEELLTQIETHNNKSNQNSAITIQTGLLNVPIGTQLASPDLLTRHHITARQCARNNIPDCDSAKNTEKILEMIHQAKSSKTNQRPLVIGFISGGGSALLSLPKKGLTVGDKQSMIQKLVRHGADIVELNTVRSALSQVKSGQLAGRICSGPNPCELVTFIISDIINDPLDKIASGPTVLPVESSHNPWSILEKYQINPPEKVKQILKSSATLPEVDPKLLKNILIGNNSIALASAKRELEKLGFKVEKCGSNLCGEAGDVFCDLIQKFEDFRETQETLDRKYRGICWLAGGETTVRMNGCDQIGLGGRCQEMGLHFLHQMSRAKSLERTKLFGLFAGTDGQDGPTPSAGVLIELPKELNSLDLVQLENALAAHDSHRYFKSYLPEVLIETGVSGTNVMDVYALVWEF